MLLTQLLCSKVMYCTDTPLKVIKGNRIFFGGQKYTYFNESISKWKFRNFLKLANVIPGFKKSAHTSKANYRSVSILQIFSKIFEKLYKSNF